jgi:CubicO group peptidase (beta-lactamase class C family)
MVNDLTDPKIAHLGETFPAIDNDLKTKVAEILNRWPAVGLAVGVVRDGRLEFFYGHGVAGIASKTPITEDTVFRIGSITKTFTAIAVMQLWEQGLIELDEPANHYLRAYKLIAAEHGHRPATVRHLLTHTSGIPEVVYPSRIFRPLFGEVVKLGQPVPSLADHYRGGIRLAAEPGTRFAYSDDGFATLGQIVEDVSGEPFDRYLQEHIFEPLGMADTDLLRSDRFKTRLATGYQLGSRGAKAVDNLELITAGGGAIFSTTRDMARYVAALLGGGTNEQGSVLKPETLAMMFEPQYQPDTRIPGIGLAFSRFDFGGHPAVEHGGIVPGFNSTLLVAPADGVGIIAFTNGARLAMLWLSGEVATLLKHVIGAPEDAIRTDVPHHPEVWSEICGWYKLSGRLTDARARMAVGAGVEVFVRRGELTLRGLSPVPAVYKGFPLHPDDEDDPYVFRVDLSEFGLGTVRVVFAREADGRISQIHIDFFLSTLEKRSAVTNPSRWVRGTVGALTVAAAAAAARRGFRRVIASDDEPEGVGC